ncbi:alpha/beta fold hydrolase [Kitasatospora sp. RG8]|uniref:alpha/beta fold hydrolase n=1 Tax=Kitasatospora sp. RG8 TaxID=2820815 RepID=UPI001ADF8EF4|nr:alpha/beta fold hydrolase [Kitasatospora sp. RG8]MBP0454831.1 alpha/beta fold hydrolase [Kitasatospora sp. RG8]
MAFIDLDGLRCHVQRLSPQDGGPPAATVVLLHGLLTDSLASFYFTLAPTLASAGLDVLMYDHRGHGRSARPATGYRLEHFTDDLQRLLDRLGIPGPVHLVGNSFGGTVAFALAARRPELVAGILAIESEPASAAWAAKLDGILADAERKLAREKVLTWIARRRGPHTARLARTAGSLLAETTMARDIPVSRLPAEAALRAVACPVLAVYGARSDLAEQAARLEQLLPNCRSVTVPGQEHSVLVETPDTVRHLTLAFLAEHGVDLRHPSAQASAQSFAQASAQPVAHPSDRPVAQASARPVGSRAAEGSTR